jgi:hypothetical protein
MRLELASDSPVHDGVPKASQRDATTGRWRRETPWLGPWSPPASQFPDSTAAGRPACADMPMFDVVVIAAVRVARWQLAEAGLFWLRLFGTLGI